MTGSVSGEPPRARGGTEVPKKRRRKRQEGKPGRDSEEELLEAVTARVREQDEVLRAVPKDETKKVRQAIVFFRRHLEQLEKPTRNEDLS